MVLRHTVCFLAFVNRLFSRDIQNIRMRRKLLQTAFLFLRLYAFSTVSVFCSTAGVFLYADQITFLGHTLSQTPQPVHLV